MTITTQRQFQSMSEFVDFAKTGSDRPNTHHNASRHGTRSFAGTGTFDEAVELAIKGWDGPRAEVERMFDRIVPQIRDAISKRVVNVQSARGRKVMPGRIAQGHPRPTIQRVRTMEAKSTRTVSILCNGSYSAGVEAETITKVGATLLALCDALTYMGVSTEVWVVVNASHGGESYGTAVRVKGYEDQTGTDRMMFALAHPAFLRRLFFGAVEGDRRADGTPIAEVISSSYGSPTPPSVNGVDFDITMGSNTYQVTGDPVAWVLGQIEGLGL